MCRRGNVYIRQIAAGVFFLTQTLMEYDACIHHSKPDVMNAEQWVCSASNMALCLQTLCELQHPLVLDGACAHKAIWAFSSVHTIQASMHSLMVSWKYLVSPKVEPVQPGSVMQCYELYCEQKSDQVDANAGGPKTLLQLGKMKIYDKCVLFLAI